MAEEEAYKLREAENQGKYQQSAIANLTITKRSENDIR